TIRIASSSVVASEMSWLWSCQSPPSAVSSRSVATGSLARVRTARSLYRGREVRESVPIHDHHTPRPLAGDTERLSQLRRPEVFTLWRPGIPPCARASRATSSCALERSHAAVLSLPQLSLRPGGRSAVDDVLVTHRRVDQSPFLHDDRLPSH